MNHYESDAVTRVKDDHAISRILALELTGQIPAWEALAEEAASELRGVPSGVR